MRVDIARTQARRTVTFRRLTAVVLAATMTTTAACDKLLNVDNPASVPVEGTSQEVWTIAEQRFTEAITLATALNDASLKNMATAGRARARLDMGKLAEAAADARLVPSGFVRTAEFSTTNQGRENRIYNLTIANNNLSVAPAYQSLTVNGTADPRVKVLNANRTGADNVTALWRQQKYTTSTAVMPIASYAGAQLILAEASTDDAEKLAAINRVRALSSIAPLAGPVTDDIIIEERRRQLFSEGQRYVDMQRKKLPFQSGTNRKGQTYSDLTCIPLPDVETQNNPNLKG